MKRLPIAGPDGLPMDGAAFETESGAIMFHACHNPGCPGIVLGQRSVTPNPGVAVIHYTPGEALEIATALAELARAGLG